MNREHLYSEKITSNRTLALFVALTAIFLLLFGWRFAVTGLDWLALVFLIFALMFVFYSVNFRTLNIHLSADTLKLTFGIFNWNVPLENVANCRLDDAIPPLMKYGGAGIHFMFVGRRYRASFNFLEYPRVVIAFKKKSGPVQDISFSTQRPEEVIRLVREKIAVAS